MTNFLCRICFSPGITFGATVQRFIPFKLSIFFHMSSSCSDTSALLSACFTIGSTLLCITRNSYIVNHCDALLSLCVPAFSFVLSWQSTVEGLSVSEVDSPSCRLSFYFANYTSLMWPVYGTLYSLVVTEILSNEVPVLSSFMTLFVSSTLSMLIITVIGVIIGSTRLLNVTRLANTSLFTRDT